MAHPGYIIVWAHNPWCFTNLLGWPFIPEARSKGAKVVVIDPWGETPTLKLADFSTLAKRAAIVRYLDQ